MDADVWVYLRQRQRTLTTVLLLMATVFKEDVLGKHGGRAGGRVGAAGQAQLCGYGATHTEQGWPLPLLCSPAAAPIHSSAWLASLPHLHAGSQRRVLRTLGCATCGALEGPGGKKLLGCSQCGFAVYCG